MIFAGSRLASFRVICRPKKRILALLKSGELVLQYWSALVFLLCLPQILLPVIRFPQQIAGLFRVFEPGPNWMNVYSGNILTLRNTANFVNWQSNSNAGITCGFNLPGQLLPQNRVLRFQKTVKTRGSSSVRVFFYDCCRIYFISTSLSLGAGFSTSRSRTSGGPNFMYKIAFMVIPPKLFPARPRKFNGLGSAPDRKADQLTSRTHKQPKKRSEWSIPRVTVSSTNLSVAD